MAAKPETRFRANTVRPFLKRLKNTVAFPIQQIAISGTPDFLLCCSGTFVALELKAEGGILSPLQKFNLDEVRRTGGIALVSSPKTWETVASIILQLDQGEMSDGPQKRRQSGRPRNS